jgi:hypothetical protein
MVTTMEVRLVPFDWLTDYKVQGAAWRGSPIRLCMKKVCVEKNVGYMHARASYAAIS